AVVATAVRFWVKPLSVARSTLTPVASLALSVHVRSIWLLDVAAAVRLLGPAGGAGGAVAGVGEAESPAPVGGPAAKEEVPPRQGRAVPGAAASAECFWVTSLAVACCLFFVALLVSSAQAGWMWLPLAAVAAGWLGAAGGAGVVTVAVLE